MRKNIRIENPVSDRRFTSKNRAKRFVAQGRAVWAKPGVSIRLTQSDHRHRAAQESVDATRYWYERAAHSGMATLAQVANLPMVAPGVLLGADSDDVDQAFRFDVDHDSDVMAISIGAKRRRTA